MARSFSIESFTVKIRSRVQRKLSELLPFTWWSNRMKLFGPVKLVVVEYETASGAAMAGKLRFAADLLLETVNWE